MNIAAPALGTIFRRRAGRNMDMDVVLVEHRGVDAKVACPALHQAERRLRALAHYLAELTGKDQLAMAPGVRVASMKRMSPPTGVQARPVATPGTLTRIATSSSNRGGPSRSLRSLCLM